MSQSTEATQLLTRAPILVFLMVAAADGKVDRKEAKRFAKLLQSPDYEIFTALFALSDVSPLDLLEQVQASLTDPKAELEAVRHAIDSTLAPDNAINFKAGLLNLGKEIAEASGGLFGIFGSKISDEEKLAITVIAMGLGLIDEQGRSQVNKAPESPPAAQLTKEDLPETVLPILKPADWASGADGVLMRGIFDNLEIREGEPVVCYAIDLPETVAFLNEEQLDGGLSQSDLDRHAIDNLEKRLSTVEWHKLEQELGLEGMGTVDGLILTGDYYCSEALLAPDIMRRAHEALDAAMLMAVAPVRGELYVTKLVSETEPEPERLAFAHFAISRFFNPPQAPIAPNVYIVRNGRLVGHVAGMDDIIDSARESAEKDIAEETDTLRHSAEAVATDSGVGLRVSVTAEDVEVMLRELQHVLRHYLMQMIDNEEFTGETHIDIDVADVDGTQIDRTDLVSEIDDMFAFLHRQFAGMGIKTANGDSIQLAYQLQNPRT